MTLHRADRTPGKSTELCHSVLAAVACLGINLSALASPVLAGTGTVPDPPTLLGVTPGDGIVTLHMQRPTNTGNAGELYYNAFCYFISNGMPSGFVGFSFTDNVPVTGQTNGQAVRCRATIVNDLGPSDASGYSDPVTPGVVPNAPTGISVVGGSGSATVTFDAGPIDPVTPVIDFEFRCLPGDHVVIGSGSPLTVVGLTNGVIHDCSVRGRNVVGMGSAATAAVLPSAQTSADLAITVTNDTDFISGGGTTNYTVSVLNIGPAGAAGITIESDAVPAFAVQTWTCIAEGVARCAAAGSGALAESVVLGAGGIVTFTVAAEVPALPEDPVTYSAMVAPPPGITDPGPFNNLAIDGPDQRGVFRSGFD